MRVIEVSMEQRRNEGGGGNGISLREPADQRHRPARFPHARIRDRPGRGLDPVGLAEGEAYHIDYDPVTRAIEMWRCLNSRIRLRSMERERVDIPRPDIESYSLAGLRDRVLHLIGWHSVGLYPGADRRMDARHAAWGVWPFFLSWLRSKTANLCQLQKLAAGSTGKLLVSSVPPPLYRLFTLYDEPGRKDGPVKEDFWIFRLRSKDDAVSGVRRANSEIRRTTDCEFWQGSGSAPTSAVPARRGRAMGLSPCRAGWRSRKSLDSHLGGRGFDSRSGHPDLLPMVSRKTLQANAGMGPKQTAMADSFPFLPQSLVPAQLAPSLITSGADEIPWLRPEKIVDRQGSTQVGKINVKSLAITIFAARADNCYYMVTSGARTQLSPRDRRPTLLVSVWSLCRGLRRE
ncbi:hypothetical protein PR048_010241 [Dryococelus australis]|uniref:Uncharacterized protein n=1 Tax=Dryococelus australis TaxID=614101 RepID=A0ABQ9I262_9NEOP|nr:hypothetical protein PR048_010241 [Dryococelus australis]